MEYSRRILVMRLSALGDVAILEPILRLRAQQNPDALFYVAAPHLLEPLYRGMVNVIFVPTIKKQSLQNLFSHLSGLRPTAVLDMHHVLRTIGLSWLFQLRGVPVYSIRKHTRKVKPSWQRYDEVFDRCGLRKIDNENAKTISVQYWQPRIKEGVMKIGVAPFAQHQGKIWPQPQMESFLSVLSQSGRYDIKLFGGKNDAEILNLWADKFPNVTSLAGKFSFEKELELMSSLDLMVSMDSSNMHFASCLGLPVVSIWGATHADNGFYGWRQNPEWCVEQKMECRPCSKYGNKPCRYGDYRCMNAVTVDMVLEKIKLVCGR